MDTYLTKKLWSKIVCQSIEIHEESKWKVSIQKRPDLIRYQHIHNCLTEHRLLRLAAVEPTLNCKILTVVKLGMMAIREGHCNLCDSDTSDILKHLILQCGYLLDQRNEMFYKIVDILTVDKSVLFFDQPGDDIMITWWYSRCNGLCRF